MKPGTSNGDFGRSTPGSVPGGRVSSEPVSEGAVRGDRGPSFVSAPRSLQSRLSSIMACGLMIILGAGMLTWYYTNVISRQSLARQNAQTAASHRAQGEMPLPALNGFDALKTSSTDIRHPQTDAALPHSAVEPTLLTEPSELPVMLQSNLAATGTQGASYGRGARKSAEQLARERLLSGAAFARESGAREAVSSPTPALADHLETGNPGVLGAAATRSSEVSSPGGDIAPFLQPAAIASAHAEVLPTRRFLLPKGAFIDCTLETAIDSSLPGMTTCITATDTFSSDGTVVLLERGTKLIGETRGQVQQGVARVFVLWTEARTPTGIVVSLDSPGADELGRSGLPGQVKRHFWDRFGAAILISTLDGAVQAAVQSASRGGGALIYNPSSPASVATEALRSSANIPPTITKRNGERIQVFVARDLDFRPVYELRSIATAH